MHFNHRSYRRAASGRRTAHIMHKSLGHSDCMSTEIISIVRTVSILVRFIDNNYLNTYSLFISIYIVHSITSFKVRNLIFYAIYCGTMSLSR